MLCMRAALLDEHYTNTSTNEQQTTFSQCLTEALKLKEVSSVDTVFFMEDDALLFDKSSQLCTTEGQHEVVANMPSDGLLTLVGGHDFVVSEMDKEVKKGHLTYRRLIHSWGAYGFLLPQRSIHKLITTFKMELERCKDLDSAEEGERALCSPDMVWYEFAAITGSYVYVVDPLFVDHSPLGDHSNTWGKEDESGMKAGRKSWEGKREIDEMLTTKNRTKWKRQYFRTITGGNY
mgnify:FL=1